MNAGARPMLQELTMSQGETVDAVVIGRNEGMRLAACLSSLKGQVRRIVYVDSGSEDGSPERARKLGAEVVALDMATPFTAARARNAGIAALADDPPDFVQFVDGDCSVAPGWVAAALEWASTRPRADVICGRRREAFPDGSLYNRLCDKEWDTPIGPAKACGGDALIRWKALQTVGGYQARLIAGEEPELCLRISRAGGHIWRIGAEMTVHDAAMTGFDQWWQRSKRAGYAYAEGALLHGYGPERHWVRETFRALGWAIGLPLLAVYTAIFWHPLFILLLLAYPAQVVRLADGNADWEGAYYTVLGKFPETQGIFACLWAKISRRPAKLIEYKAPSTL